MNPEKYKVITDLFHEACDLADDERTSFLARACGEDRELRQAIERMLAQDGRELPASVPEAAAVLADDAQSRSLDCGAGQDSSDLPKSIGHFNIIDLIAQGGMGIVYRAEQDNPRREVALKVIHPGLASAQVVHRFENEAHVLGRLQHSGIAQIYEAGVAETDLGNNRTRKQPFFAMEYIHGEPLNTYVAAGKLALNDKLQLFTRICDAVEHAHQHGVIHRDLKPANILVDSTGQPKILDFGVARVTDSDMQTVTLQTNVGQLVGTIPYMSPEQVSGQSDDLDTRSDIYALGVLFFELLSGKLPYDVRKRSIPDAARIIQEDEPTRLGECDTSYRGDLETITMKALQKEKSRRYATAAELADDIRRYLADKPIAARAPSSFYHLGKFAKRNKAVVGGVLGTVLALAVGLAAAIYFALDARSSAAKAQWTAYTLGIAAAQSSITTEPIRAARDLNSLSESLRNWEWYHLHAQLDSSIAHCEEEGIISSVAFLADGTPVAALIQNGAVTLVDVNTCETIRDFGPGPKLKFLSLSADGAWLGGFDPDRQEILIWNVTEGLLVNRIPIQADSGFVSGLRFTPTGRLCYILGEEQAGVLDVQSGQFNRVKDAKAACFLDSASSLVLGDRYGNVDRINLQSGSVVSSELRGSQITCLSASPDGDLIAVGTIERAVHLLDGQLAHTGALSGHASDVSDVLFLKDNVLASSSMDGTVRIWDLPSRLTTRAMNAGTAGSLFEAGWVTLAASPDRTQILSSRGNEVTLLDLEGGAHRLLAGHSNYVYFATHSPDGTMIASSAYDNKLILWDALTGEQLATMPCDETLSLPYGLSFTHDGSRVIATTATTFGVWDLATGQRIDAATGTDVLSDRLKRIKESQSQEDFFQALFDEQAGGGARSSGFASGLFRSVSDDGTLLIQGKRDGGIDIVTRKDMNVVSSLAGHETQVNAVAISADNTLIASAGRKSVIIWERAGGREIARFANLGGDTYCLEFSPDGSRLVSGDQDGVIRLWDTGSYELAAELKGHGSYVHSVLFSPDGTQLVSASGDHTVRIWDTVSRGKRLEQIRAAEKLRGELTPTVDRLLDEYDETSDVAEHLRSDPALSEDQRRAALRVLLTRTQARR